MIDEQVSVRINILRTLLIAGIVLLHVPPGITGADLVGGTPVDYAKFAVNYGFFHASVPLLTCISGYLLFFDIERFRYQKTLIQKSSRILFPFLLWNIPLVIVLIILQSRGLGGDFRLQLVPFDLKTFLDATLAFSANPLNYPLQFLRDLFILFVLSPLFLLLLRSRPFTGLALVSVIFLGNFDGLLIIRGPMPVCFYLGGLCAVRRWGMTRLDRFWPLAAVTFLCAVGIITAFAIEEAIWFRLIASPLVWIACAPLASTWLGIRAAALSKDSFFLFLSHGPILLVVDKVHDAAGTPLPYWFFWIGSALLVCTLSFTMIAVLRSRMPSLASFVVGDFKKKHGNSDVARARETVA